MRNQPQMIYPLSGWQPATYEVDVPIAFDTPDEARADMLELRSDCRAAGVDVAVSLRQPLYR